MERIVKSKFWILYHSPNINFQVFSSMFVYSRSCSFVLGERSPKIRVREFYITSCNGGPTYPLSLILQEFFLSHPYHFKRRLQISFWVYLGASVNIRGTNLEDNFFMLHSVVSIWEISIFNCLSNSHTSILQHEIMDLFNIFLCNSGCGRSTCMFVCRQLSITFKLKIPLMYPPNLYEFALGSSLLDASI